MSNIDNAFAVEDGISIKDSVLITTLTTPPTSGFEAPEGSLVLYADSGTSTLFVKTGTNNTDWHKTLILTQQSPKHVLAAPHNAPGIPIFRTINMDDLGDVDTTTVPPTAGNVLSYDGTKWYPGTASGTGSVTSVSATAPASGFTITGSPITSSGTLVFALSDDLAAVENLTTTGIVRRTNPNVWAAGGVVTIAEGGTGLTNLGTSNTYLSVNNSGTSLEYKSLVAGSGISITHSTGATTFAATNTGTVTSVALTAPSFITVTGSPITTSGTIDISFNTQPANYVLASPSASTGIPTFRELNIDNLGDVSVPVTPSAGSVLTYNGTAWTALSSTNLDVVVAMYYGTIGASSGTSIIPLDNTTPLITEGTELWTKTVTPTSTSVGFSIRTSCMVGVGNSNRNVLIAIFRDNTCVYAAASGVQTRDNPTIITVNHIDVPNTTTPIVYSARIGLTAGGSTWYVNQTYNATLGGQATSFEIQETRLS